MSDNDPRSVVVSGSETHEITVNEMTEPQWRHMALICGMSRPFRDDINRTNGLVHYLTCPHDRFDEALDYLACQQLSFTTESTITRTYRPGHDGAPPWR